MPVGERCSSNVQGRIQRMHGASSPPTTLVPIKAPQGSLQILRGNKKEGENFEEEGGRRKGEYLLALNPGSTTSNIKILYQLTPYIVYID